jgi:autotransporter-associated beta strand protein
MTVDDSATLSVSDAASLGGIPDGLTLQGGGVFAPSASLVMPTVPVYVGTGNGAFSLSTYTLTVPGDISTTGTTSNLTMSGNGGTAILSGNNTGFLGDLIASGVTLQVGTTSNLGSNSSSAEMSLTNATLAVTGDINSNRGLSLSGFNTITVATGFNAIFNGTVLAEAGSSLTKTGSGNLTLLSAAAQSNTDYSLVISAGSVVGNTFSLGGTAISIAFGSNLTLDQTASGTFNGRISGLGSLVVQGTGPLLFTPSSSTYSGGTLLEGALVISQNVLGTGTISANDGSIETLSTFSLPQTVQLSGSLTLSPDAETTLELTGTVQGTGNLIKEGLGTLFLNKNSPYTGNTYVYQGTLLVGGNISSSDVTVNPDAVLNGTGTVGNTNVYGTINGGSSADLFGTLSVLGSLVLEEGSTFSTVISSDETSLVSVSGPVGINTNTTYELNPVSGTDKISSKVVLSGSSITGTFTNVIGLSSDFLNASLTYTDTQVLLSTSESSIVALATGQNAINVANALDAVIAYNRQITYTTDSDGQSIPSSPPELTPLLASLFPFTTTEEMTYALNQLHPAQMKGMAIAQQNNAVMVRESISQRMRNELDMANCFLSDNYDVQEKNCCGKDAKIMTAWMKGSGDSLFQQNESNVWGPLTGYRANTGSFTAGIDGKFAKYFYAGALGGYTHSHLRWKDSKGSGNVSSGYAGIYFSVLSDMFYANLSMIGSLNHYSANRHIQYEGVDLFANNGHGGSQLLSHGDAGATFSCYGLTFRPFESFDYITQTENGYQEDNAGSWDLAVAKNNAIMLRNELGLQFAKCYCYLKAKWIVSPKFSWVREMRIKDSGFTVNFAEGGPSFFIEGYFPSRNLIATGLTLTALMLQDALRFDLSYSGEFKGRYAASHYGAQIRYCF